MKRDPIVYVYSVKLRCCLETRVEKNDVIMFKIVDDLNVTTSNRVHIVSFWTDCTQLLRTVKIKQQMQSCCLEKPRECLCERAGIA